MYIIDDRQPDNLRIKICLFLISFLGPVVILIYFTVPFA
jgi:hypothetical protein